MTISSRARREDTRTARAERPPAPTVAQRRGSFLRPRKIRVGDDALLDLGGALEDPGEARVAPVALERELAGVAGPAVDLDALARHLLGHLAREVLGHRRFDVVPLALVGVVRGGVRQVARRCDLRSHPGDLEADGLK